MDVVYKLIKIDSVVAAVVGGLMASLLLGGCTVDAAAQPSEKLEYSTDGRYLEIAPGSRGRPVSFVALSDTGTTISSKSLVGKVYVINFWFAGCGPCIAEAPTLQKLHEEFATKAEFIGVNTYDQAATALAFERNMGVTYPSIIDTNDVKVQLAFADNIPPNSTPTTLIVDRKGRVAARIIGIVESPSILRSMLDRVLSG